MLIVNEVKKSIVGSCKVSDIKKYGLIQASKLKGKVMIIKA